jgi:hypothetical protein
MKTREYVTTRIWVKSLKRLRLIGALTDESIVEVIDRLSQQELERLQEGENAMMKYVEWSALACRGAVDPLPPQPVEGRLLVGERAVLSFEGHQSPYGEDVVSLFPAFHNGVRCWVRREEWSPAFGYSASGTSETLLSFEEGVKVFLERGVFAFPAPQEG